MWYKLLMYSDAGEWQWTEGYNISVGLCGALCVNVFLDFQCLNAVSIYHVFVFLSPVRREQSALVLSDRAIAAAEQDGDAPRGNLKSLSAVMCLGKAPPRGDGRQNVRSPKPGRGFRGSFLLFNILKCDERINEARLPDPYVLFGGACTN